MLRGSRKIRTLPRTARARRALAGSVREERDRWPALAPFYYGPIPPRQGAVVVLRMQSGEVRYMLALAMSE